MKISFRRLRRIYYLARATHASTTNNVVEKSIRLYLHSLHDVPMRSCTLYEILSFHKDLYKVDEALVHAFSLISISSSMKMTSLGQAICKWCIDSVTLGKVPSFAFPYNMQCNTRIDSIHELTTLEERLVSLWIAFTQIWQLGYKRAQYG